MLSFTHVRAQACRSRYGLCHKRSVYELPGPRFTLRAVPCVTRRCLLTWIVLLRLARVYCLGGTARRHAHDTTRPRAIELNSRCFRVRTRDESHPASARYDEARGDMPSSNGRRYSDIAILADILDDSGRPFLFRVWSNTRGTDQSLRSQIISRIRAI